MIFQIFACMMVLKFKTPGVRKPMSEIYENINYMVGNVNVIYEVSDEERALMERVIMSEAGGEPYNAQEAVATVILNRVFSSEKHPDTITEVISEVGQFSTAYNGEPTVSVRLAVNNAIGYYGGPCMIIPPQVYYFRDHYYHDWALNWCHYGDLYFSAPKDACIE